MLKATRGLHNIDIYLNLVFAAKKAACEACVHHTTQGYFSRAYVQAESLMEISCALVYGR